MQRKVLRRKSIDTEIEEVAARYAKDPEAILEVLLELHASRGVLNEDDIGNVAHQLSIPAERAFGVSTFYSLLQAPKKTIRVCDGPACWLKGAAYVRSALESQTTISEDFAENNIYTERSSCLGLCDLAPAVLIGETQSGPFDIEHGLEFGEGRNGGIPNYGQPIPGEKRVLLQHAGEIDPNDIESAIAFGAYQALQKALAEPRMKIIDELEISGLRGRGGAGFPVGKKWRFVAEAESDEKLIICNADESEPLTFKDRVVIDANPHKILEGMLLAGYAVGARNGYIYIRGEYTSQAKRLESAIQQAEEKGWLGENIQGSEFSFYIHLHRGAGAYICGEETALIESLEGKRGEPRIRPPYPANFGYHGKPTVVNNVETLVYVPDIVQHGGNWYLTIGNPKTPGTKLYTLVGNINRPGLFEAPYGITLRKVIEEFGDGMSPGCEFHFALTGGAAGTIVSNDYLDIPIDYSSSVDGVSLGSGAILICDQTVSPLVMLRELMFFFEVESCGKCTPCRIGTRYARITLDRMIAGKKSKGDKEALLNLAAQLQDTSFCGLGQSAAIPIQSAVRNFEQFFI
jgi:NADH:ubiquinone oxidoreductase subunit F (NADH-binding)/NADH:ubiquinone oxidoreductase subunit E